MKLSELIVEVLEENPDYAKANRPQKLIARTTIKRTLGKNDDEIPDEAKDMIKAQLSAAMSTMPVMAEEETGDAA